tara:strand:+ start:1155 stop:1376 length:222 start_codon:yes stop_codon:yes gene_type:complete
MKQLIKKQIKFIGIVVGTMILTYINYGFLYEVIGILDDYSHNATVIKHMDGILVSGLGLTVLQVWLVTKYLQK